MESENHESGRGFVEKGVTKEDAMNSNNSTETIVQGIKNLNLPFIPRKQVGKITGNLYSPRYLSNLDCAGQGPAGRVRIGKQICYPTEAFIEWLLARITQPQKTTPIQKN